MPEIRRVRAPATTGPYSEAIATSTVMILRPQKIFIHDYHTDRLTGSAARYLHVILSSCRYIKVFCLGLENGKNLPRLFYMPTPSLLSP
jgi:hypothetical protein